jgi:sedoheptulokinase
MLSVGIDIGTTSCKLCILSSDASVGVPVFAEQLAHHARLTRDDAPLVDEQCPSKIVQTIDTLVVRSCLIDKVASVKSIQICGQMHGIVLWASQSPRTTVSSLVTWQDQRCSAEFLAALAPSLAHLRTGYGLATLLWLLDESNGVADRLARYDRAGTIADYLVAVLCDVGPVDASMSTQMARSWGALDDGWPVDHRLLPNIVEPGTRVAQWKGNIPVYVPLGDLQCSVFSCRPGHHQGIVNLSTSAQLALVVQREKVAPDR